MLYDLALPTFRYHTARGARIPLLFRLRRRGTGLAVDVSAATSITLEWERSEVAGTPLVLSSLTPNANWLAGDVVAIIGPLDLTALEASVECTLVVTWGTNVWPAAVGIVEVEERPGYVPPP